ncbi:phage virion morphogenesis protein [Billgrantia montanilacus]|uniref:Phage virion morphogenesis protein n=1 Tax=Billgrantia montanilacus TaxID=2282305 RepID=A0A368TY68_9GAMM|nr:phage virion morphogenesis protein [Halomonas montanilacus]RCV89725.1 phage virion morphogenesis protein [Halomonas montanilacus]
MSEPDLQALETWVQPLIAKLTAGERRQLARDLGRDLRISQRERINAQQNPDGTRYEPRAALRGQAGGIRRKAMFNKLRTAKHIKARVTAAGVQIGFVGRVARIARVHQYGLRDRVEPGGPMHNYPRRELLGLTRAEQTHIRDKLIEHLT